MSSRCLAALVLVLAACGDDAETTTTSATSSDGGTGGASGDGGATSAGTDAAVDASSSASGVTANASVGSGGSGGSGGGGGACSAETCNGLDDDCSGRIDDGLALAAQRLERTTASYARVAPMGDGFAFTYSTSLADLDVTLQRLDASGAAVGEPTLLTSDGGDHVTVPRDGGFYLLWLGEAADGVFYAAFDETGEQVGDVQTAFLGPVAAFDAVAVDGGLLVALADDDGVETQALSTVLVDTTNDVAEVVETDVRADIPGRVTTPRLAPDGSAFRLFWTETSQGGFNPLRTRRIDPAGVGLGVTTEPLECCDTNGLGAVVPFGDGFAIGVHLSDGSSVVVITSKDVDEVDYLHEDDYLLILDPAVPGLAVHDGRLLINTGWRLYIHDASFEFVGAWTFALLGADVSDVHRSLAIPTENGWAVSAWGGANGGTAAVAVVGPNGCDLP